MFRGRELMLQFCRFGVVGIFSLAIDYGLLIMLTESTEMGYFFASAFSYTVSVFVNYILSMKYVFHSREDVSKVREASTFFILSFIGLGFNQMVMWFAVDVLQIYYAIAKILSALVVTSYNFVSRKTFIE